MMLLKCAKGGYVKQYIIYGAPGGVGDYNSTTGKYHIPIEVSAEGHTSITTVVQINDPLYENDWINYETQEYCVTKTNLTNTFQNLIAVSRLSGIDANGDFNNPPGRWPQFALSDYYEIEADAQYELPAMSNYGTDVNYYQYANVNMYDENYNRTRTILRGQYSKVIITPLLGEKYLRIASSVDVSPSQSYPDRFFDPVLYRLKEVINPVPTPLQQIQLIPNTINTIDVLTTVKPLDMYVETVIPPDPDPDDPMSEYTGIIYNDGVLDITQEDPDALNELTVHFRDNVDKVITIPSTPLEPATTTTLGGVIVGDGLSVDQNGEISVDEMTGATDQADGTAGIVPAPLTGDENKFLRGDGTWSVVQSGDEYIAGDHINFSRVDPDGLPAEYTRVEYIESGENTTVYLDTGYDGNTGFTTVLDLQYYASSHRQLMGLYPGTGNYFGSNADEHFEMGSGVHAASDTTQRNTVTWHHTLTSSAKLEWNGSYITDQNGYGGYNGNFLLFSPFSDYRSQVKIFSCIMYDNNDQVVRNFIPCKTALGVPGFYDTVTEQFYSGQPVALIAGPVVPPSGPTAINADDDAFLRLVQEGLPVGLPDHLADDGADLPDVLPLGLPVHVGLRPEELRIRILFVSHSTHLPSSGCA